LTRLRENLLGERADRLLQFHCLFARQAADSLFIIQTELLLNLLFQVSTNFLDIILEGFISATMVGVTGLELCLHDAVVVENDIFDVERLPHVADVLAEIGTTVLDIVTRLNSGQALILELLVQQVADQ